MAGVSSWPIVTADVKSAPNTAVSRTAPSAAKVRMCARLPRSRSAGGAPGAGTFCCV